MNKINYYLIIVILLIPFVLADIPTYRTNTQINLTVPCKIFTNNSLCSSSTNCNISIISPDTSIKVDNQPMTRNSLYYNFTVQNNSNAGTHTVYIYCTDGIIYGQEEFQYNVNASGNSNITPIVRIMAFGIIALIIFLISYSLGQEHFPLKLFLLLLSILIVILIIPSELMADSGLTSWFKITNWSYYLILGYILIYPIVYFTNQLINKYKTQ